MTLLLSSSLPTSPGSHFSPVFSAFKFQGQLEIHDLVLLSDSMASFTLLQTEWCKNCSEIGIFCFSHHYYQRHWFDFFLLSRPRKDARFCVYWCGEKQCHNIPMTFLITIIFTAVIDTFTTNLMKFSGNQHHLSSLILSSYFLLLRPRADARFCTTVRKVHQFRGKSVSLKRMVSKPFCVSLND